MLTSNAEAPIAVLFRPVVLVNNAELPIAVLSSPIVLKRNAKLPTAVLVSPVVLQTKEPLPIAILVEIFPPPLPIPIPFTVKVSLLNVRFDSTLALGAVPFKVIKPLSVEPDNKSNPDVPLPPGVVVLVSNFLDVVFITTYSSDDDPET